LCVWVMQLHHYRQLELTLWLPVSRRQLMLYEQCLLRWPQVNQRQLMLYERGLLRWLQVNRRQLMLGEWGEEALHSQVDDV